jgi:hypothetical protein
MVVVLMLILVRSPHALVADTTIKPTIRSIRVRTDRRKDAWLPVHRQIGGDRSGGWLLFLVMLVVFSLFSHVFCNL